MRKGSPNKCKEDDLNHKLRALEINKLGKAHGFRKRRSGKIRLQPLLVSFYKACFSDSFSLSSWALHLSMGQGLSVSKQAVFYRIDKSFVTLTKKLLEKAVSSQVKGIRPVLKQRFQNVYIQDGLCIKLPASLNNAYRGNYSNGATKAVAKLQVVYNATKRNFKSIALTSFTRNDQAVSADIVPLLRKGDLVIRDLGYFVLPTFRAITALKADFISRYKRDVTLLDSKTGDRLSITRMIKGRTVFKQKVLVGAKEKLECVLVAVKISSQLAEARRRKAMKDRDRRMRYSKERQELLGWDIYLCSRDDLDIKEVQSYYAARWQIEIIFKSWKSGLRLERSIPAQLKYEYLAETIIYLQMLFVVITTMPIYNGLRHYAQRSEYKVSLLKTTRMIMNMLIMNQMIIDRNQTQKLARFTFYETRNRNTLEDIMSMLA